MTTLTTILDVASVAVLPFSRTGNRVLCYHKVGGKDYYTVPVDMFEKQMGSLHGAVPSFDDGTEDSYTTVLPILIAAGVKGIFFITTDWIGKRGYLSKEQLVRLVVNDMIIGSHSCSHPDLDKIDPPQVATELEKSKAVLEGIIGKPVDRFAYPYGKCRSDAVRKAVLRVYGKDYTTTHRQGSEFRTTISGFDTFSKFQRKVRGCYDWWYKGVLPLVSK